MHGWLGRAGGGAAASVCFFFNDPATTEIYTLSLHDALPIPGPRSRALMERRTAALPRGVYHTAPLFARAASGAIVEDVDGNRLIDLGAGLAVMNVGNSAPAVQAAVRDQLERLIHTCQHVVLSEPYLEL